MIFGIGVDLVETSRIRESLEKFADRFARKVFTPVEQEYCNRMPDPAMHYAARFAAKEAFLKALGTGKARGIAWTDVGIVNLPGGQPVLAVTGRAAEVMAGKGAGASHVSLSHSRGHAMAAVVLEKA